MSNTEKLNPLAKRAWMAVVAAYPDWEKYFGICAEDDLEVAIIPAPAGSNAGHLVIFTSKGKDLWIRFGPPSMCYPVDDETEMLNIIGQLLAESTLFLVIRRGGEWAGTTLIRRGQTLRLKSSQVGRVVSWSGKYDRIIDSENLR